jgi:hypothetical protein
MKSLGWWLMYNGVIMCHGQFSYIMFLCIYFCLTLVYWYIIELWVSIQTPFGNLLAQLHSGSHLWSRVSLGLFFPFFALFFLSFKCTVNQLHRAYITCMEFQHIIVVFPLAHFTGPTYTYLHFFLDYCNHHYFFLKKLLTKILGYSSNFLLL